MTNLEIYRKTFRFTLMRMLSGLVGTILIVGLPVAAFFITQSMEDGVRLGVCIGAFVAACIVVGLLSHFIGYLFRAGQIAMAARAIAEGELPEDPYTEGKQSVKKRFGTVAVFFAIEKIIKGIVRQITNGVTRVTSSIGGGKNDTANTVGAVINIVIAAMLQFMCACCMGWVFLHADQNPWRAACDGAIVYFKNWKDLLKNAGKVIAFGLISLIVLGGLLFGLTYLTMNGMPFMDTVTESMASFAAETELPLTLTAEQWALAAEGVTALILWCFLHSAFVDPYIMISVMNRYLKAGLENPPARSLDEKLSGLSKTYKKAVATART